MQVLQVPEIESYSDLVDLLASTPKLQERLKTLKEMQDGVNASLGDLEEVRRIKGSKHAADVALADAKEALAAGHAMAAKIKADAENYARLDRAQIESERAALQREREDLAKRVKEHVTIAAANNAHSQSLEDQQRLLTQHLNEALAREKLASSLIEDFVARKKKVLEIFE